MRKITMIFLLTAMAISSFGQNATQARKILDKTAAIINSKNGATANFTISGTQTGTVSGVLSIKGNMFHIATPQSMIWYNGKTQWTYLKSTDEVNISTPTQTQQMTMNPYRFINMYKSGYNIGMTDSGKSYNVHLTAQKKNGGIQEMYIFIDKKSYQPSTVKLRYGKGWTTITVRNFKAKNLSNKTFTFSSKDFPHAEIIDLR